MNDLDLDRRLRDLGNVVPPPAVPLGDDLARGRARLRRHRLLAGAGAMTAVALIGLATAVGPGIVSADPQPGYSGGDGDPLPGPETTPPVKPGESEIPRTNERHVITVPGPRDSADLSSDPSLSVYHEVLVEHLDPEGRHLDPDVTGMQSGAGSLGATFGWRNPGQKGLGLIDISVNAGWYATGWSCGMPQVGWTCRDIAAPGGLDGEVAEYDDTTQVAVEHADGTVVVIAMDPLFANSSTMPVAGIDLTAADLAAAAADQRLELPGPVEDAPELLSQRAFEAAGLDALVTRSESYRKSYAGNDVSPWVDGRWSGRAGSGELFWDASPTEGTPEDYECPAVQFTRCVQRDAAGHPVMVGYVKNRWGGGVQVIYRGPAYEVRVVFEPVATGDGFPVDRAAGFVVDDRWQP